MHWLSYYLENRQVLIHTQRTETGIRAGQWRLRIQGPSGLLSQGFLPRRSYHSNPVMGGTTFPISCFLDASLSLNSLLGDTFSSSLLHSQKWENRKEVDEWRFCQLSREVLHFSVLQYIVLGRNIISKSKLKSVVKMLWHLYYLCLLSMAI
jgi:hypothetical protein